MKFALSHQALAALAITAAALDGASAARGDYCPPLGAVLPAPKLPSKSPALQAATKELAGAISSITSKWKFSAASVSVKSLHEDVPLFTQHYTPPMLDPRSVATVDSKTVYRVGSASKAFTMLAILKLPGLSLDDPVTKYLPKLKKLKQTTADLSALPTINWDDITIGALAAHLAGVGVDCTSFSPQVQAGTNRIYLRRDRPD